MTRTYPHDEFDVDDPGTGRRGAHRAKPNPLVAVVPLVLVTVAVVAIIVGAMTLLGGSGSSLPPAAAGGPSGTDPAATAEPTEPPPTEPSPTGSEPTEPEPTEPEPTVDPATAITVLNGTTTAGLAGAAAQMLHDAEFSSVSTDNFRDGDAPASTVFYGVPESAATAEAVAAELGVSLTELDAGRGEGVVVLLGDDYSP